MLKLCKYIRIRVQSKTIIKYDPAMSINWTQKSIIYKWKKFRKLPLNNHLFYNVPGKHAYNETLTKYRFTHNEWDFRDDCTKLLSSFLTSLLHCIWKKLFFFAKLFCKPLKWYRQKTKSDIRIVIFKGVLVSSFVCNL